MRRCTLSTKKEGRRALCVWSASAIHFANVHTQFNSHLNVRSIYAAEIRVHNVCVRYVLHGTYICGHLAHSFLGTCVRAFVSVCVCVAYYWHFCCLTVFASILCIYVRFAFHAIEHAPWITPTRWLRLICIHNVCQFHLVAFLSGLSPKKKTFLKTLKMQFVYWRAQWICILYTF